VYRKHSGESGSNSSGSNTRPVLYEGEFNADALVRFILDEQPVARSVPPQGTPAMSNDQLNVTTAATPGSSQFVATDGCAADEPECAAVTDGLGVTTDDSILMNTVQQLSSGFCLLSPDLRQKRSGLINDVFKCSNEECKVVKKAVRRAFERVSDAPENASGTQVLSEEITRLDRLVRSSSVGIQMKAALHTRRAITARVLANCEG
jgi:hypothetical protein